jgi:enamine deaminase RidA (YjgF/YER057c/UK114 family)
MKKPLLPAGWVKPRGYANGVAAVGTQVFIAGQIGWDAEARFQSNEFAAQAIQALRNVVAVLNEAGGKPEHLVRMTWYVTDKREYLMHEIGETSWNRQLTSTPSLATICRRKISGRCFCSIIPTSPIPHALTARPNCWTEPSRPDTVSGRQSGPM